jgi:peptidoglycan/xylan/chitin deacetylase (PgdA/CDA1 family)
MADVLVLCYHATSFDGPVELAVRPDQLERQARLLTTRGYRCVTFSEAVLAPKAPKTVAFTFDDAYRSVFDVAFPLLRRLGVPATVFVPTAFPDRDSPMSWPGIDQWLHGPYERALMPMSWDELSHLAAAGWEIGSHTHTHPRLTRLDDKSLARELAHSRDVCSTRLGIPCRSLSYPYGDYDGRVVEAASSAGYDTACTLARRLYPPAPLRWPRISVHRTDDSFGFRLKVSPALRYVRSTAVWDVVGALRRRSRSSRDAFSDAGGR